VPVVLKVSRLEIERRARGLNQTDLARLSGVSRGTISAIERGDLPRVRTALALAKALGVELDVLLPVKNDEAPAITPGLRDNFGRGGDRYDSEE
jgi:transcriptional regulator with XRE-family HTH domain